MLFRSLRSKLIAAMKELDDRSPKDLRRAAVTGSLNLLRTSLLTVLGALSTLIWTAVSGRVSKYLQSRVDAKLQDLSDGTTSVAEAKTPRD